MTLFPRRARTIAIAAAVALLLAGCTTPVLPMKDGPMQVLDNGAARTPLLGWSSWSFLRDKPTEEKIKAQALAMSTSGLLAAGYEFVNLDDFYYLNPATTVDEYGRWVVDSSTFPSGMASLSEYIHGLGEKFGMYVTPGIPVAAYEQNTPIEGTSFHARDIVSDTTTFAINYNFRDGAMYTIDYDKNPEAAQAFLNSWANQLASFGIDYLKIDGVSIKTVPDVEHWSTALLQTGRIIHFELSNTMAVEGAAIWKKHSNGWRTNRDIEAYVSKDSPYPLTVWSKVRLRFDQVIPWIGLGEPGGWNDLDSIEVGNGDDNGITPDERKSQLTLWALENSNLTLGVDLTRLDPDDLQLLLNPEVLAVNQAGRPARPIDTSTPLQVWLTKNEDGSVTVGLFNLSESTATVSVRLADLGITSNSATVRDLWAQDDLGSVSGDYAVSLPSHGCSLITLTPA